MKRRTTFRIIYIFLVAILFGACGNKSVKTPTLDLSNMDTSVDPAEDFYTYVNGKWNESTEIPADEGRWGSFNELRKSNNQTVLSILEKSGKDNKYAEGSDQKKAVNFYAVGMDSVLAEKRGIEPIQPWLKKIESIENIAQLQNVLIKMHKLGFSGLFGADVFADLKQSDMHSLYLGPNGLGLPNRDYYTKDDDASKKLRDKYIAHISLMFNLTSKTKKDYSKEAEKVYKMEHQLALASLTPIEERNLSLLYNKMSIDELSQKTPSIDWAGYLSGQGLNGIDSIIVTQPNAMAEIESIIRNSAITDIQWYLKWHLINMACQYLNQELVQANFNFYGKELNGTKEMKPRWERVLGKTNASLGEALGKLYVDEVFPPEAKIEAKNMVNNIQLAFKDRILALEWMSEGTKKAALVKLDNFTVKIGYPDKWKDYTTLIVEKDGEEFSYFGNILHANRFKHEEAIAKIGKPVDKTEWHMNPQTVNAYYSPVSNEIVFPAAILQPPFYYYQADPAVNYGAIGAVIGHEMSHGFDDMGSRFDEHGNMKNWWNEEDKSRFDERSKLLVDQFNNYEPLEDLFVQGELTLGENIGDLGGINVAYDGLQKHFETNEKLDLIEGFTQEQRFFLSWGTIWRTKYRDEFLRKQVLTDPHSPAMYRVEGPLANLETFYEAFDVNEGDPMWKPDSLRIKIW